MHEMHEGELKSGSGKKLPIQNKQLQSGFPRPGKVVRRFLKSLKAKRGMVKNLLPKSNPCGIKVKE
jgi:hypothetical protein